MWPADSLPVSGVSVHPQLIDVFSTGSVESLNVNRQTVNRARKVLCLMCISLQLQSMLPHSIYPLGVSFSFSSLSEHHVGSLINMFKVLRLRILFDIFLNVPAGQVGFQILFHHKIHGCLPSQKHKNHILNVLRGNIWSIRCCGYWFACVLHLQM